MEANGHSVLIPLTNGGNAIVDASDAALMSAYRWHWIDNSGIRYAVDGKTRMHRVILRAKAGTIIDHANGDGLDNRRCNIRFASTAQNAMNKRKNRGQYTSIYKGVHLRKDTGRWRAWIERNNVREIIGNFKHEIDAALAYDERAKELFGEFARLNFIPTPSPHP